MNQRDMFFKWLFYSAAALLFLLLQGLVLDRLPLWQGIHPYLPPLIAIIPAVLESRQESTFFAIGVGMVMDLLTPTPFSAFYTLVFAAAALLTQQIAKRVIVPGYICALLCGALAQFLTHCGRFLLMGVYSRHVILAMLAMAGRELVLTLPWTFPCFWLGLKIYRRMRDV